MSRHHTNRENKGESAFGITYNKGYFMNINGYRISVQFGTGNYVDADVRYGRQKNVDDKFDTSMDFNVWQSNLAEVMIDVIADDGSSKKTFTLNKPNKGLYIPNGIWREMENFSAGAVCLVLASDYFDESDYFRNYKRFIQFKST